MVGCFAPQDEKVKISVEANLLYLAMSALGFSYAFIEHCCCNSGEPLFAIPQIHFVDAGIAVIHAPLSAATAKGLKMTIQAIYLV